MLCRVAPHSFFTDATSLARRSFRGFNPAIEAYESAAKADLDESAAAAKVEEDGIDDAEMMKR